VWRAQSGEAYWYGPTGGLLRLPVRAAAWSSLIEAEKTTRQRGSFSPGIIKADIDLDGEKEILYQGSDFNAIIHPRGAVLAELDSMRSLTNYANALGPDGREERRGMSRCFHDHIYGPGTFLGDRGLFLDATFALAEADLSAMSAVFSREGEADIADRKHLLAVRKRYAFRRGLLSVEYEISNREAVEAAFRFATELNLTAGLSARATSLSVARGHEREDRDAELAWIEPGLTGWRVENRKAGERLEIRSDLPFELSHLPLARGIESEGEYRDHYQGARFLAGWDLVLSPGALGHLSLSIELARN
jgi:hypothetical protein